MDIYKEILEAEKRIRSYTLKTPLFYSNHLSKLTGANVYLKLESEQYTGSFKARGSMNKILSLSDEERKKGIITTSTGNHGLGVARAMSITKTDGVIYLPKNVSPVKLKAIMEYGVTIEFHDDVASSDNDLFPIVKKIASERGLVFIPPYDDPQVIGGQGTIGLEIASQLDKVDYLLATIGGGGLISGIATYLKKKDAHTKIIGCLPQNSPDMYLSVKEDRFILAEQKETLSDGSAGGFENGSMTFDLCKQLVDDYILISEEEIKDAIRLMVNHHHKIIEGAAGVSVASLVKDKEQFTGKNVVVVVCGSNIATEKLKEII